MSLFKTLAFAGGDWIIVLLSMTSVLVVAVALDRAIVLFRERKLAAVLARDLPHLFAGGDIDAAQRLVELTGGAVASILSAGLKHRHRGIDAMEEHITAAQIEVKTWLERRLLILGTLGNNAPFVGLFGTVLGVIKAFHDLAVTGGGPEVVMSGLSEALIATAVGLLVAIPSVLAFNYFQKRVSDLFTGAEVLVRLLLADLKSNSNGLTAPRHPVGTASVS